jgi:regulatory protein
VRSRLARAQVSEAEAELVLAELIGLGYLDDARYARLFAQDRQTLDRWGHQRIARALAQRGIARELIAQALTAVGADEAGAERDRGVLLLEERLPAAARGQRDRERAFGLLVRRGYDSETAADAVREWQRRMLEP